MGELTRTFDWSRTSLGGRDGWPEHLRTAVGLCLNSAFPTAVWWGQDLLCFHNDGYTGMLGPDRHPGALGRSYREVWPELWASVEPLFTDALDEGRSTYLEDQRFLVQRDGGEREAFFTFSLSPIRGPGGAVAGVLNVVAETTARELATRRLRTMSDLGATPPGRSRADVVGASFATLGRHPSDIPFALLYRTHEGGSSLTLEAATGLDPDHPLGKAGSRPIASTAAAWEIAEALSTGQPRTVRLPDMEGGRSPANGSVDVTQCLTVPLSGAGSEPALGALVLGLAPTVAFDEAYRTFLLSVGRHFVTVLGEIRTRDQARTQALAVAESEVRFRSMADTAPLMLWVADREGRCVYLNRRWSEFTGQQSLEGLGDGWMELVHPEDRDVARSLLPVSAAGSPGSVEYRLLHRDGGYRWVLGGASPRIGPGQEVVGYVGSLVDISDRKAADEERERLLAEAQAARFEAERADEAKSQFLASMSHELRTPLNAIGGYVDLLDAGIHGPINDAQRDALERILVNERHLLALINDVLSFASLGAGTLTLTPLRVEVGPLMNRVASLLRPQMDTRSLVFRSHVGAEAVAVDADAERFMQILLNLLTNAMKFTPAGGSVDLDVDTDADTCRITVRDTGIGIAEDRQEAIFDPFVQVAIEAAPAGGTGLGLSISRQLAREMKGEVTVVSALGEGSAFTLTLPRVE